MQTAPPTLMTIEEFLKLPDPPGGHLELHHGEPVFVSGPYKPHVKVQRATLRLLVPFVGTKGFDSIELPFQPSLEHEYWVADYGFVSKERWDSDNSPRYFQGAPNLVVEVKSPSDKWDELNDNQRICLTNGCSSFWIADPKRREVHVTGPDLVTRVYMEGMSIPLPPPLEGSVAVSDIFADI